MKGNIEVVDVQSRSVKDLMVEIMDVREENEELRQKVKALQDEIVNKEIKIQRLVNELMNYEH